MAKFKQTITKPDDIRLLCCDDYFGEPIYLMIPTSMVQHFVKHNLGVQWKINEFPDYRPKKR